MSSADFLSRGFQWLWIGWGVLWLAAAPWSAATRTRQPAGERLRHSLPLIVGGGLLLSHFRPENPLSRVLLPTTAWLPWLGLGLTAAGLLFTVWARVILGRMWSGRITLKQDHSLVQRGPYALARHPIYTGLLVALLGTTLARPTGAALLGFVILTVGLVLKLRQEERLLAGHFGVAYASYRQRVKGLIPFIW
jgi:protein-S-isoprenylcysteine O-methyltransferase Ste14